MDNPPEHTPQPVDDSILSKPDNTPKAVRVRAGYELGTMRWVLILGIVAAILAMIVSAIGLY